MSKLIYQQIKQALFAKSSNALINLQQNLILLTQQKDGNLQLANYLHQEFKGIKKSSFSKLPKNILNHDKKLQNSISNVGFTSKSANHLSLNKKKNELLSQLKKIDYQLKNQHINQRLRIKHQNTEQLNEEYQRNQQALSLIKKMNKQRQQFSHKKIRQAINMQEDIQSSLKQFIQREKISLEEKQKKRLQIEQRIQMRKQKIKQLESVNKQSNKIIRALHTYKITLPEIHKKSNTPQIMLTNIETQNLHPFLQKIAEEENQKRHRQGQKKIKQQRVRQTHKQYVKILKKERESKLKL